MRSSKERYDLLLKHQFVSRNLLVLLSFPSVAICQGGVDGLLEIAGDFGRAGLHEQAIVEYHRAGYFAEDSLSIFRAYYGLGLQYRCLGSCEKAEQAFKTALSRSPNDSLRQEATIALAAAYITCGYPDLAVLTLFPIVDSSSMPRSRLQGLLLLVTSAISQYNWSLAASFIEEYQRLKSNEAFADSCLLDLRSMIKNAAKSDRYSPEKAKLMSTIPPGSGQIYAGDLRNGLNAFTLNALNFWVVVSNIYHADYVGALLYFVFITERYYSGNWYRAEQIAIKANEETERNFKRRILLKVQELYLLKNVNGHAQPGS